MRKEKIKWLESSVLNSDRRKDEECVRLAKL